MGFPLVPIAIAAGSALSAIGQSNANEANAKQAQLNREFQERMSNTAWQRGVADMKAAGLNPALAYEKGGASVPTGSSAQMGNVLESVGPGLSQASAAAVAREQVQIQQAQSKAQVAQTEANTALTWSEVFKNQASVDLVLKDLGARISESEARTSKTRRDEAFVQEQIAKIVQDTMFDARTFDYRVSKAEADLDVSRSTAREIAQRLDLARYAFPKARAEAGFYEGAGRFAPYVNMAKDASAVAGNVNDIIQSWMPWNKVLKTITDQITTRGKGWTRTRTSQTRTP